MKSPWIRALRSVTLTVPDLASARQFYTQVWKLDVAAEQGGVLHLRGSGHDHHLLALRQAAGMPRIVKVTLRARSEAALEAIASATRATGGSVEQPPAASGDPAGGRSILIRDPDGRRYEIVHGDRLRPADDPVPAEQPVRLSHVVLNSHDVAGTQAFLEQALGFVLSDRTRIMAFMNCDVDHHTIALGDGDNDALNHIAFAMPTLDAVMRGGGRMKDAGHAIEWGPGRHGPGANAFNYFIDPFGIVIEYTADVEQIDDGYEPRGPDEWKWPTGRVDAWGISPPPSARLKEAQRAVVFSTSP